MTVRASLLTCVVAALLSPSVALSQAGGKVWRVGVLVGGRRPTSADIGVFGGLVQGLRDLGYVEGKNLVIEWRFAEGDYGRFPALAGELVRLPVDVLVPDGTPATREAQKATQTIPIVFPACADPVGDHIVKSLSRPGANTTGVSLLLGDTTGKQLELIARMVPGLSQIAVLHNQTNPTSQRILEQVRGEAPRFKLQVIPVGASTDQELERAFQAMAKDAAGAFLWIRDPYFNSQHRLIAELALKYRVPGLGGSRTFPEVGGLMSYAANGRDNLYRAATYIDKIFRGARPGDLPVEQPTKLEFVINRKAARALGLTIPPELLLLADQVIE